MRARSWQLPPAAARPRAAPRVFELRLHLQSPQGVVPHGFECGAEGTEGGAAREVKALPVLAAAGDEPGLAQRFQLERDRAERDVGQRRVDVTGGALAIPDESEDLAAARGGDGGKH